MTTNDVYIGERLRRRWDYDTGVYTEWDANGGVTVQRPFTADETAEATAFRSTTTSAANAATLTADTTADIDTIRGLIDTLAVLLADDTTSGSIRQIMGPSGATAGTGSLRALKAQTNTAVVNAASIKAFLDLTITLAQRTIDDAQATRRIARQVLRLARLTTGDTSSTDVGGA